MNFGPTPQMLPAHFKSLHMWHYLLTQRHYASLLLHS